jgi:hypothetical protein
MNHKASGGTKFLILELLKKHNASHLSLSIALSAHDTNKVTSKRLEAV